MSDDVHNPFGGQPKQKKRQSGVFDPDYEGDDKDPFKSPPDDSHWDEPLDEPPSTKDT